MDEKTVRIDLTADERHLIAWALASFEKHDTGRYLAHQMSLCESLTAKIHAVVEQALPE